MNQENAKQIISSQQSTSQNTADLKVPSSDAEFQKAQGPVPYGMTNDYMFRAVLQSNNTALQGLICSLLHLRHEDVKSVEITNPITLGQAIESKEFRLDINVNLNNHTRINLEMQVAGKLIWPNRSLSYLCRSFDMLNHGQDYQEIQPVIHISFLDYTLFDEYPEFYATNKLLNVKNYNIYSDKLTLSVVDLTQIALATEEDKEYHIDYWAKLFKATTWEEIKMLAAKDQYIGEASKTIFRLSADEQIRKRCLEREEYYLDRQAMERTVERQKAEIADREAEIAAKEAEIADKNAEIADKNAEIADKNAEIADKDTEIHNLRAEIKKLKNSGLQIN